MKKKFVRKSLTIAIAIMMVFAGIGTVKAANGESVASATLKASNSEVTAGETFTVTLSAKCEDGINGLDTTYSYNSEILELKSANLADSSKWSNLGADKNITIICNSTETIKSADIYVLTFKVKDTAKVGSKAEISTTSILLDSDVATDSEKTIGAQTAEVTVVAKASSSESDKNKEQSNTGSENEKSDSSSTTKTKSNTDKSSSSSNTDSTKKDSILPYTGSNVKMITISVCIIALIGLITFLGYRKYRKIR